MVRRPLLLLLLLLAAGALVTLAERREAGAPPGVTPETLAGIVRTPGAWRERSGRVVHVSDGDTFRLDDGAAIRLVGVDAPEIDHGRKPGDPGGREAAAWAKERLLRRAVTLYVHPDNARDRFGRVPALVFTDGGECFNLELLRAGHARVRYLHFSPDVRPEAFRAAAGR